MLQAKSGSRELASNERWFLVETLPKRERRAQWHLGAQQFDSFLPLILKTVRHARKLRTIQTPLFLRYLFIKLDLTRDRWSCVRSTVGVLRLISYSDGHPIPVPKGIVEMLIERSPGNVTRLDSDLYEGQNVRILSGPFADLVGTLAHLDDAKRVKVLLNMMGTMVPITLNRSALAPAA